MGDINVAVNNYLADNERFADLFNVTVFDGEQIIAAEELSELDTKARRNEHVSGDSRKNGRFHGGEYIRDQLKQWKKGARLLVLGLEPESSVHYALPVKLMKYESIQYEKEYQKTVKKHRKENDLSQKEFISGFAKTDRLKPMLTIALYHGKEEWDAPESLHGMLDFDCLPAKIRENARRHCNDFYVNLFDVNRMENSDRFRTDLKEVFGFLMRQNDKEGLRRYVEQNEAFRHLKEDAYDVIALYSGSEELTVRKETYQKEEAVDMCKALQEMWDEARTEGMEAGRAEGIETGRAEGIETGRAEGIETGRAEERTAMNRLICHLMEDGRTDDLLRSAQDAVFQKQLMEEYGICFPC